MCDPIPEMPIPETSIPEIQRPVILTLEGPDGCGKSTLSELLETRLRTAGRDVLRVREPGSTPAGQALREVMKSGVLTDLPASNLAAREEAQAVEHYGVALTMQAARVYGWWHQELWLRAHPGGTVIRDRSWHSTLVYQSGIQRQAAEFLVGTGFVPELMRELARSDERLLLLTHTHRSEDEDEGDDALDFSAGRQLAADYRQLTRSLHGCLELPDTTPEAWGAHIASWLDQPDQPANIRALGLLLR